MLKRGAFDPVGPLADRGGALSEARRRRRRPATPDRLRRRELRRGRRAPFQRPPGPAEPVPRPETGYVSRPYPKFAAKGTDYDHLARVAEWALSEGDET